jgi:hypothetical protein
VELLPKKKRMGEPDKKWVVELAAGLPKEPSKAVLWVASVMDGVRDNREAQFATVGQRLAVFTGKKKAALHAKKQTNEFWSAKVRAVRLL